MDNLTLALKLAGKEKTTEEKSELVNPSTASIVYMVAVTASSGGEVVLKDEIDETAEWEEGDFTEVDEDGDFEEYEPDDDPMEDVDDTVVDMTDGDGVDIEEAGGEAIAYTVTDYHNDAVAAYSEEEGEVVEDDVPDEDVTIDDDIDDGDAEVPPQLLVFDHAFDLSQTQQIVTAEVHTKQEHENGGDILHVGTVGGQRVVFNTEATGACAAEGGQETEEKLFVFIAGDRLVQHQDNYLQNR